MLCVSYLDAKHRLRETKVRPELRLVKMIGSVIRKRSGSKPDPV